MAPTQERKRNNRQINKTFSLPMEEVLVQPLLLSPYFCLKYAVHCTWYFFLGLYSRAWCVSFASDYYQTFPRCYLSPANTSKGAINLFPTTHMLQKERQHAEGHHLKEAIDTWQYIKQQDDWSSYQFINLYIFVKADWGYKLNIFTFHIFIFLSWQHSKPSEFSSKYFHPWNILFLDWSVSQ